MELFHQQVATKQYLVSIILFTSKILPGEQNLMEGDQQSLVRMAINGMVTFLLVGWAIEVVLSLM